ncbi:ribonuclease 1-like isoform X2 [Selaginella moellendorffii]|uniref:ribonuclease 1-like isoform X2 n=1 Tax=Selaginella moellendorffii TaxID=88036 RepID=UPI000D1CBDBC|nr:ribonuclease 1-like isoform X2 [Selaginella moellendorffii]|eukprot:XP_024518762.1 ribonuclease 1-like isoform X2 [Selaginella moellendorffii]
MGRSAIAAIAMVFLSRGIQGFDMFLLVLEAGQVKSILQRSSINQCCYPPRFAANFTLHGLWPVSNATSLPEYCDSTPYNASQIADLMPELRSRWPSLTCPQSNGDDFWEHEWEAHGSCAFADDHDYFATTLRLRDMIHPLADLGAAGIVPNGSSYAADSILRALHTRTILECSSSGSRDYPQLYQIYYCVDRNATGFVDCPAVSSEGCSSRVAFLGLPTE